MLWHDHTGLLVVLRDDDYGRLRRLLPGAPTLARTLALCPDPNPSPAPSPNPHPHLHPHPGPYPHPIPNLDSIQVTPLGKILTTLAMISGVLALALPITVIGSNFAKMVEACAP